MRKGVGGMGTVPRSLRSTLPGVNRTVDFLSGPVAQSIVTEERRVWRRLQAKCLCPTRERGSQLASCLSTTSCQSAELSIQNERLPSGRTLVKVWTPLLLEQLTVNMNLRLIVNIADRYYQHPVKLCVGHFDCKLIGESDLYNSILVCCIWPRNSRLRK